MAKKLNKAQEDALEQYYLNNEVSIRELSEKSNSICGVEVSRTLVSKLSRERGWDSKKRESPKEDMDFTGEIKGIANILSESIKLDWKDSKSVDASKVNAFMNLVNKLNIEVTPQGSSKSELQMIIEALKNDTNS